jgi:hypothetical protein
MKTILALLLLFGAALGGLVARATPLRADDDGGHKAHLITAGELPRLRDRGITLHRGGDYTVKVWAPARQAWSVEADGPALTLAAKVEGDDARPTWRTAAR